MIWIPAISSDIDLPLPPPDPWPWIRIGAVAVAAIVTVLYSASGRNRSQQSVPQDDDMETDLEVDESLDIDLEMDTAAESFEETDQTEVGRYQHPFEYLNKRKRGYARGEKDSNETIAITREELLTETAEWLGKLSDCDYCCVTVKGCKTTCKCLAFLNDKPAAGQAVAEGVVRYFDMDTSTRNHHLVSEQRLAKPLTDKNWNNRNGPQKTYQLPVFLDDEIINGDEESAKDILEAMEHPICVNAFTTLYNKKRQLSSQQERWPMVPGRWFMETSARAMRMNIKRKQSNSFAINSPTLR